MTQSKNYKWIVVGLLWVVALLNYLDRQMLSTLRPVMQIDIAELQTAENFGRLMAIFLWIYGFMSPIAGLIADKTNKKWLIVISLFIWSGVTLIMGYAQTFDQLYWLRAIMGVSEAFYIPAGLSLIADFHTSKTRSLAVGVHLSGLYVGQALGGFGATIAQQFSWNGTFLFFGLVGMIYSFVLVFFLDVPKKEVVNTTSSQSVGASVPIFQVFSILLSNVSFWIILLIFTVPSLPGWGVKNWLPTLYSESLGIEMAKAGPIATITNAMSSLVGVIIGGIISDKWLEKNMRGRVFVSALGLGLTIPALFLIAYGSSLFHIVLATFCFGFGFGMFDTNNMPILCQFVDSKYRSTAYGTMNLMGISAGAIVTTFLGKSVDDGNLKQDFAIMALVVLGALIIQLLFLRPKVKNYSDV